MKLKGFCNERTLSLVKGKLTEWGGILTNYTSSRELLFKIYNKLKKLDDKITQLKNSTVLNRNLKIGNSNDRETCKEMFNIINHQGNANQNFYILLYTY